MGVWMTISTVLAGSKVEVVPVNADDIQRFEDSLTKSKPNAPGSFTLDLKKTVKHEVKERGGSIQKGGKQDMNNEAPLEQAVIPPPAENKEHFTVENPATPID